MRRPTVMTAAGRFAANPAGNGGQTGRQDRFVCTASLESSVEHSTDVARMAEDLHGTLHACADKYRDLSKTGLKSRSAREKIVRPNQSFSKQLYAADLRLQKSAKTIRSAELTIA